MNQQLHQRMTVKRALHDLFMRSLQGDPLNFFEFVTDVKAGKKPRQKVYGLIPQVEEGADFHPLLKAMVEEFVQCEGLEMELLPWVDEIPSGKSDDPVQCMFEYLKTRLGQMVPKQDIQQHCNIEDAPELVPRLRQFIEENELPYKVRRSARAVKLVPKPSSA